MTLVIGTDEAGYGPFLGPLVVAASAWRVAAEPRDAEAVLARAVAAADEAAAAARGGPRHPLWADSKQVYKGGTGFALLERAALIGVAAGGGAVPGSWPALAESTGPIAPAADAGGPWRALPERTLPLETDAGECAAAAAAVRAALDRHGVAIERVACRGIYPREFNASLARGLNKSDILSAATLDLAATLRGEDAGEPALVWCDRHGGRKRYGGLVAGHFRCPLVTVVEETQARSVYLVPSGAGASCRIEFCVGGESRAPVAVASLVAKYVRELAMHAFNGFWSAAAPGLEPTAGYPTDAARWWRDAGPAIERTGIAADDLWRRA